VSSSSALVSQDKLNEKPDVFRAVLSFYGPTDMALETPDKTIADPSNWIMRKIFPGFSHLCHKCLNPGVINPEDPRMSPLFADPHNFPENVLVITAAQCAFAIEGERLATNLEAAGKYVKCRRMEGCAHGWDKEALRGTSQCKAKDDAYAMAVEMLQRREDEKELR
jgi:acetyl esterase/lipase